jgi:dTDP-4-amino-4,6-dideoxygalactose transaminase
VIYLSPPDVGPDERELLLEAFDSNWIAPTGPDIDAFEAEFAATVGVPHAVAVSSGTAALHLILHALGIRRGDTVLVQTFTFAATAFAVTYTGAEPIFVDSELDSWNVDPQLVEAAIIDQRRRGRTPKALIAVDLYGRCANYEALTEICERYGVILIEDAAEALGSTTTFHGTTRAAGTFGVAAAFSFNGNKIITTSGGGMVTTHDGDLADRIRYLSTQAREPVIHYEHREIGFNYRMSNLLAALGRGQLVNLDAKVKRRREINLTYRERLGDLPGLSFDPYDNGSNYWLTCLLIDPSVSGGVDRHVVQARLNDGDIESRPLWLPMHRQPIFRGSAACLNGVSDRVFLIGLCLPSGSALIKADLDRVIDVTRHSWKART